MVFPSRRLLVPLLALAGCATTGDSAADEPLPELDCHERVGGSCGEPGDTGTLWLVWHGSVDVTDGVLTATRGIAGKNLATGEYGCDIAVEVQGTEPAETSCPDCEWAYAVEPVSGGTEGPYCDALTRAGTMFEAGTYTDFYFGRFMDGVGWAQVYPYASGYGYTFYLENVVFAHLTSPAYDGWYVYGYNYPANGVYHVRGTSESAVFEAFARNTNADAYYYYFAY